MFSAFSPALPKQKSLILKADEYSRTVALIFAARLPISRTAVATRTAGNIRRLRRQPVSGKEISMRAHPLRCLACFLAASALLLGACASDGPKSTMPDMPPSMSHDSEKLSATAVTGSYGPRATYKGKNVSTIRGEIDSGLVLSDSDGGLVVIPGEKLQSRKRGYVDAREFKLKIRELSEQLIADIRDCSLQGTVALPTAFVNLDNFNESSSLGRLISEQLFYEFNQRGFPIREYRIADSIRVRPKEGEFSLSRELGDLSVHSPGSVVIVGTYSGDRQALFINARLVRPSDGRVLRTANLVLEGNPLTSRLMRNTGKKVEGGEMRIRDYTEATRPLSVPPGTSPFDRGEDIH